MPWSHIYPSPSSAVVFSFDTSKTTPQVSLKKPVKLISNFREWMCLFSTYASVYSATFPHEAPALFTYMVKIYVLSQEGRDLWHSYDEAFRKLKAKYPSVLYQEHNPQLLNTLRHKECTRRMLGRTIWSYLRFSRENKFPTSKMVSIISVFTDACP